MAQTISLRAGSHTVQAELQDARTVLIDGISYDVQPAGADLYRVRCAAGSWLVAAKRDGETIWVGLDGLATRLETVRSGASTRRARGADDAGMRAPMPATVAKVLVALGAEVKEGDTLLVLEAMKMELPIRAARAGRVVKLLCGHGQLVAAGAELLELA